MSDWKYFTRKELQCKCGCGKCEMDEGFMEWLDDVRDWCDFPFIVTSGYRCAEHDLAVGSSSTPGAGPHTTGLAVDIKADSSQRHAVLGYAFCGEGAAGVGIGKTFLHLDALWDRASRPRIWVY